MSRLSGGIMKTTKADFEYYKKCVLKWLDVFQLNDWEIDFEHKHDLEFIGSCRFDLHGRGATICLAVNWEETIVNKKELDATAFHEVVELLLVPYYVLSRDRKYDADKHTEVSHQLIRTLEYVIFRGGNNRAK